MKNGRTATKISLLLSSAPFSHCLAWPDLAIPLRPDRNQPTPRQQQKTLFVDTLILLHLSPLDRDRINCTGHQT